MNDVPVAIRSIVLILNALLVWPLVIFALAWIYRDQVRSCVSEAGNLIRRVKAIKGRSGDRSIELEIDPFPEDEVKVQLEDVDDDTPTDD